MKVTIEFDGFEEKEELRKITKYGFIGQREATDQERESAERFREEIRRLLDEWNLNLD